MKEKITIYTSKTCAYCDQVKNKLKESSIEFVEKDIVESKEEWDKVWNLTINPITPTIAVGDDFLLPGRDFNGAPHLINIIKEFKPCMFSFESQILERVKSLNYNIMMAFVRTDQLLRQIEIKLNIEEKDEHKSTS